MKLKKDDTVMVVTGKDRGHKSKVREVVPRKGRVVVEGVNTVKRHTKPRGQTRQAGIVERDAPIPVSKVMLICPKCDKPTRIGIRVMEDGSRVRVCRRCSEVID